MGRRLIRARISGIVDLYREAVAAQSPGSRSAPWVGFSRTISISFFIQELKRESSKWAKTKGPGLADFYWQSGYGAFSVSPGHVDELIAYIENQEEHHRTETFQDELRRLMTKYGIEWDERYVWD